MPVKTGCLLNRGGQVFVDIIFHLPGITDKDFLRREKRAGVNSLDDSAYEQSMYEKFQKMLAEKLKTDLENVNVLSVMHNTTDDSTDVRFAAHGSPWYQSSRLDGIVTSNLADVSIMSLVVRKLVL